MAIDKAFRLSPSGPRLTAGEGPDGPPAVPGTGMILRLDEKKATVGGAITGETPVELGSGALRAELANVNAGFNYKAYCQINSVNETHSTGEGSPALLMTIQRSIDNGTSWEDVQTDKFEFGASSVNRMAVCNAEMELGSASWDLPAGYTEKMIVRCMVQVHPGSVAIPTHQGFIGLGELL